VAAATASSVAATHRVNIEEARRMAMSTPGKAGQAPDWRLG
jgi:hypothetical protein